MSAHLLSYVDIDTLRWFAASSAIVSSVEKSRRHES